MELIGATWQEVSPYFDSKFVILNDGMGEKENTMESTAELKLIVQAVADNMKNHTKYRFTLECWISELSTGKTTNQSNFFQRRGEKWFREGMKSNSEEEWI